MPDNAIVGTPADIAGQMMGLDGQLSVNNLRPWVGKDGHSYINVNGQAYQIQTNALLQKDEWINLDNSVRQVANIRLNGIADLRSAGLVYNAGDLGTTIAEWEAVSDMTAAEANMAGVTMSENDSAAFSTDGTPIPVIRKDFAINIRRLLASRRSGASVDTIQAQTAMRLVAEKSEEMLFNGLSIKAGTYTVYGYTNHPQRNTVANTYDWAAAGTTGANIITDVLALIDSAKTDRHYGPYMLYIPQGYESKMNEDYSTSKGDNNIRERIEALADITAVRVSDTLATDNVVLVQMTADVVDLAVAQDVTTVQWERGDGMQSYGAVLAAWAPRIKPDYNDRLGVVHGTFTS